jgi:membrane-bound lytic murein transglycosylase A
MRIHSLCAALTLLATVLVGGCTVAPTSEPQYARPLPSGGVALRRVTGADVPNLERAWLARDQGLTAALKESKRWYIAPSSRMRFPYRASDREITHAVARASVQRFADVLASSRTADAFRHTMLNEFEAYESVGWNGEGVVLFTGYYAPEFPASRTQTGAFQFPIYTRPSDLVTDPRDGHPIGQRLENGSIGRYPTRGELDDANLLAGSELAWLQSPLDAYVVHVNGSAKFIMPNGEVMFVGYNGKTDRPYTGVGSEAVAEGLIAQDGLSLSALYDLYDRNPGVVERLIRRNENFVFFMDYDGKTWPSGSLGVKVHPRASLATDKAVYPAGSVCLVDTQGVGDFGGSVPFFRFMVDQDTGGAIKAPGRADIYMGEGDEAETLAGGQLAEGRLYYFFLK